MKYRTCTFFLFILKPNFSFRYFTVKKYHRHLTNPNCLLNYPKKPWLDIDQSRLNESSGFRHIEPHQQQQPTVRNPVNLL